MAMDLTKELLAGYDDMKAGRPRALSGPLPPGVAYDIGYWMAGPGSGGTRYPRPVSANASRAARQVRVKWSIPDTVNVVRGDLGGTVWEWVNAKTIRRA
jgi:hypothetical protein